MLEHIKLSHSFATIDKSGFFPLKASNKFRNLPRIGLEVLYVRPTQNQMKAIWLKTVIRLQS